MEGYIGIQKITTTFLTKEDITKWDRKYFVLTSNYKLHYFNCKKDFKNNKNINRPIEMNNYESKIISNDESKEDYTFSLIPIEEGISIYSIKHYMYINSIHSFIYFYSLL
jgi:hypothetical protein